MKLIIINDIAVNPLTWITLNEKTINVITDVALPLIECNGLYLYDRFNNELTHVLYNSVEIDNTTDETKYQYIFNVLKTTILN